MTTGKTPQPCHIQLGDDQDHFVALAAEAVLQGLKQAIEARGQAVLAVPGGTTPGPVFDRLAQSKAEWAKVTVTLVDERMVEVTSPDSNERLVRERLLQGQAAAARFAPLDAKVPQPIDVAVLGMGEDGHIASLFPGSVVLKEALTSTAVCLDVPTGEGRPPPQPRRSLTLSAINSAHRRILLITGQKKWDVYRAALHSGDPELYPVAGVLNAPENLSIFVLLG